MSDACVLLCLLQIKGGAGGVTLAWPGWVCLGQCFGAALSPAMGRCPGEKQSRGLCQGAVGTTEQSPPAPLPGCIGVPGRGGRGSFTFPSFPSFHMMAAEARKCVRSLLEPG